VPSWTRVYFNSSRSVITGTCQRAIMFLKSTSTDSSIMSLQHGERRSYDHIPWRSGRDCLEGKTQPSSLSFWDRARRGAEYPLRMGVARCATFYDSAGHDGEEVGGTGKYDLRPKNCGYICGEGSLHDLYRLQEHSVTVDRSRMVVHLRGPARFIHVPYNSFGHPTYRAARCYISHITLFFTFHTKRLWICSRPTVLGESEWPGNAGRLMVLGCYVCVQGKWCCTILFGI